MMTNTVCYKTIEPTYYNKGTKYESSCDEFLAFYCPGKSKAEITEYVTKINNKKPKWIDAFGEVNWSEIAYFFVREQEEMY